MAWLGTDATTLCLFREKFSKAGLIENRFDRCDQPDCGRITLEHRSGITRGELFALP
jgi:hypothetical protein